MGEKRCSVCGDDLDGLDYGGGTVWTCDVHGTQDWHFEQQRAHWLAPPGRPARAAQHGELPLEPADAKP
ncbi:MAG: hypothetical protein LC624_02170 [Halobacteriales archaeon]|nr:hypothetical protein [Halobacteriales archaeon]